MPKFEVTIIEAVSPDAHMEIMVEVEAIDAADAIGKAKPLYDAKFGRTYVVKTLSA